MDISQEERLLTEFQAGHGWRFKFAGKRWWVWKLDHWAYQDALDLMSQAMILIAGECFPENKKIREQLGQSYLIERLAKRLRGPLHSDTLIMNPRPVFQDPTPASRPPSELPAP